MQGVIITLQIPASGFPKQPQLGTQESPAPGKKEQIGSPPMPDVLSESMQVLWWGFGLCSGGDVSRGGFGVLFCFFLNCSPV